MKTKIYIAYALLSIIWGTTWYALKVSLNEGMVPTYAVGIRFFCSGLIFWGILFFRREKPPMNNRAISIYLQFGFLNFGISYALTYWATQFIYSNLASILWASFPIITALMAHFYLPNDKLNKKKMISLALGIAGTFFIISQSGNLGGENVSIGIIVILIAIIIAAWPNAYLKKYGSEVNTFQLNAMSHSIGGIFLLCIAIFTEPGQAMIWTKINVLATVYLIIFGSVITFSLYFWLFSYLSLTQITYVTFFPPIIAILIGWIFLDEQLSFMILIGAGLIVFGALLINYRKK
ncbi:MAG: DMT family transporter [Candidatus Neomarinimicrobiota bacterium]